MLVYEKGGDVDGVWYWNRYPGKPWQFGVYLGGFKNCRERGNAISASGYEGFALNAN